MAEWPLSPVCGADLLSAPSCLHALPLMPDFSSDSSTPRLLDPVLCFHRHSRFVRSILVSRSRDVGESRRQHPGLGGQPGFGSGCAIRWFDFSAPQLYDFLTSPFVFIDIPGSFVEIQSRRHMPGRSTALLFSTPPAPRAPLGAPASRFSGTKRECL